VELYLLFPLHEFMPWTGTSLLLVCNILGEGDLYRKHIVDLKSDIVAASLNRRSACSLHVRHASQDYRTS
jgi:hypothetical protein